MTGSVEITIREAPYNRMVYRLAAQLEPRVRSIIAHFTEEMAREFMEAVQRGAPTDIAGYPDNLVLHRYLVHDWTMIGVTVPFQSFSYKLRDVDAKRTVIYVQPKTVAGKAVDPAAVLLWENNPWTMETLPYEPGRKEAKLISRRVSKREAKVIEQRRNASASMIDSELRKLGKKPHRAHPVLLERRVIRDLAFEILRREYGLGDAAHVSHWRPALRRAKQTLPKQVLKGYIRWLAVPSETRWKKALTTKRGRTAEMKQIQRFQRYVTT